MTIRDNILKTIRFEKPDYIPMTFSINAACWHHYDQQILQDLMESHPLLFPHFKREKKVNPVYGLNGIMSTPYTDPWGCVWKTTDNGITGSVTGHPLKEWDSFHSYTPPDPEKTDGTFPVDWQEIALNVKTKKAEGELVTGGLPHGHSFLRLQDIRGYENLMYDMADNDPRLTALINMVEEFNSAFVEKWLAFEPDIMSFPEDLGMQMGPMLSPDHFVTYIKPLYERLMRPARERGCLIHMHSDGDIRLLADDLIDGGVEILNLQDLVNGIDWIASKFAGKTCIELDIDRQNITARGTPEQIDHLIRKEVEMLGSPQGGLMMIYGLYPGVPFKNIKALMDSMERYSTRFS